jgi:hypothetical protein
MLAKSIRSAISKSLFLLIFGISSSQVQANWFLYGDLSFGGDKMTDLDSFHDINGGGLFHIAFGREKALNEDTYLTGALGIKSDVSIGDETNGNDLTATFRRFPIDVGLDMQLNESNRLGFGLTYHLKPKLKLENEDGTSASSVKFDNALGLTASFSQAMKNEAMLMGVKLTSLDYETRSSPKQKVDANSISFFLKYLLD